MDARSRFQPRIVYSQKISTGCPGLPGVMCSACPPATMPLKCAAGQKVDFVSLAGDDGSCDCDSYCASDWNGGSLGRSRPHWIGATSAFPPGVASTCCVCVQATHWREAGLPKKKQSTARGNRIRGPISFLGNRIQISYRTRVAHARASLVCLTIRYEIGVWADSFWPVLTPCILCARPKTNDIT